MKVPRSPLGRVLPRRAGIAVREALADTRVVLVNGARQCGKSTLVAQVGDEHQAVWRSLDNADTRLAAHEQPTDFVQSDRLMVIDEIQRNPDLLLSIKETVDADPRPGRFLLTGSARILGLRNLPDTLVGRMETVELWPLSQGEIDDQPDGFVDAVFAKGPEFSHETQESRKGYIERVLRGGFPEALAREGRRRRQFHRSYVSDLINRDIMQLSEIQRFDQMIALIELLASRSGQLLVANSLSKSLEVSQPTVKHYLQLFAEVFLIKRIPAWTRSIGTSTTATPKVAMVDSGLAASLLNLDASSLSAPNGPLGPLLEGFVAMELARQLTWSEEEARLFHYRTKDKVEVDIVLQTPRGKVIAFEVKAGSTVRSDDFRGLRHLEQRLGDDFLLGGVFHTGPNTFSFGPKMRSIPIAALWETPRPT